MTNYFHPQPWRTFTTPLTIPRAPDASNKPYSPQTHSYNYFAHNQFPWRSATPPSLSPSPSPSTVSSTSTSNSIEIEELELTEDADSGVELLIGEYEEAPEDYRRLVYDSDLDSDDEEQLAASHKSILYGLERLTARGRSPAFGIKDGMAMRGYPIPKKGKRSYAESEGSSVGGRSSWGDSGMESELEGERRRVRRRVVRRVEMEEEDCVSVKSWSEGGISDNEIDMEL